MILLALFLVIFILFLFSVFTVPQGALAVIILFGKYRRVAQAGLNMRIPFLESVDGYADAKGPERISSSNCLYMVYLYPL